MYVASFRTRNLDDYPTDLLEIQHRYTAGSAIIYSK